jgi:hypothetical protein
MSHIITQILHLHLISKLQTIVMEGVAHPGISHAVGRQPNVILTPYFFILQGEDFSQSLP